MRGLLISAAIVSLLAAPVMAQPGVHPGGQGGQAGQQNPPPINRGNAWRLNQPGGPQSGAPQRPLPAPAPGNNRPDNRPGGNRPDFGNRPDHGRPDNNRPGNRPDFGRPDNRPGNPGYRPGNRPDYSHFRDYHRAFRAPQRYRAPAYRRPSGWYYRRWSFGDILPSLFWSQSYWLTNYMLYGLPPPPFGAVWVRYGNDALLIDRYTGEVISVQYDVFY